MTPNEGLAAVMQSKPRTADQLRREWFLARVDWHLDSLVPSRERKRIIGSLRDDIAAESSRHGMDATLAGLGGPRALAHSYTDGTTPPRPKWARGIIAAGAALLLYWIVFFAYTLGMLTVVEQSGIGHADSWFLFLTVTAFADESGIGVGWDSGLAWVLMPFAVVAIVFLWASRAWRVLMRRTR